ncbi:MAG TPA: GTPase Era [Deltaproteobacteria bacterium]|nr:MAG: GTPase Era [Deltaproteobacteria bacterium GWA2_55_82]OGQ63736.1 MAG: GTPase Era [Deltaproteobacteria bacterium RIFCSPLOWO2_02_FULL_55_12]OIJ73459.1 MAG: GTPase Era [Deltaproteobacteria bacterium GWC2_55_46]HBG47325.1 GTPase Era [Deltaproteobacteria bacterium]HCY10091.1 GTPase Era [Deltaproteobacteria bacterium]
MSFRSGFVSIIGRPNAGKSTLLNSILGEKISIVSPKPQTTRNVVRGVKNLDGCQIVFLDTPGIHKGKGLLNEFMVKQAVSSIRDVDAVVLLVEADRTVSEDDLYIIKALERLKCPVLLGINKVDRVDKRLILPIIDRYTKMYAFKDVIPLSALKGEGVELLVNTLSALLPEGPKYFPDDVLTDVPERFIAAEIVREKVFIFTREEIPYSVAVTIDRFEEKKEVISIAATINVERDSQKGIVIGKGGAMLKKIGTAAREDIEKLLASKVFLELFVRVQKEWTKKPGALKEFGY